MGLIHFSINNPVKVTVAIILAILFGLLALWETPVQLTPDVEEPKITVTTRWPGASALEIEKEIIEEQEEQLKSVQGLLRMKSSSSPNQSSITLEFPVGTNLSDARARVSDKLNQVPNYPEDAREPVITSVDPNANAIAWFILKPLPPSVEQLESFTQKYPHLAEVLSPFIQGEEKIDISEISRLSRTHAELRVFIEGKHDPAKLRKFAEDVIEARFERVPGIANSNVYGGQEQEFRIILNPTQLAAYNLTIAQVRRAVEAENRNTSAGDLWEGKSRNVIRILGQYETPQQVAETIVATYQNRFIKLQDVGKVELSYKKPDGVVRQKGLDALACNAQQAPGTNVLEIIGPAQHAFDLDQDGAITQLEVSDVKRLQGDSLRVAMMELNLGVLKQRGLVLEQVYDQSEYINSATSLVTNNMIFGGSLAILVLLIFLRNIRSVFIVGMAIPISVIATFLFVRAFGRSLNVISLAGMAFAVGMVVDNAIVVLENIFRHYQMGEEPETAALRGTHEVWGAVLASTLTTLAVFVPVIFVQGQAGQLFRDIAIAISCAVALSLIVSITVIPTAATRILKRRTSDSNHPSETDSKTTTNIPPRRTGLLGFLLNLGHSINNAFAAAIHKLLIMPGSTIPRIGFVVIFVFLSIAGAWVLSPKKEYLPNGNRNLVIALLIPPPGYNVEKMIKLGESVEREIAPYWEAKPGSEEARNLKGPLIQNFFFVARGNRLFMGAKSLDPLQASELVPLLRSAGSKIPGTFAVAMQASLFQSALSGGRTIDIEVTGPDLETLMGEAGKIFGMCMQEFPMNQRNQLRPDPGLDLTSPEVHILARSEAAAEAGLTTADLGYSINALVDGAYSGDYWHLGNKIDLVLYGADEYARNSQDIDHLPLSTSSGELISVSSVANVIQRSGPDQVNHSERVRTVTIQLTPAPEIPLQHAMDVVERKVRIPLMSTPNFESGLYQIRLAGTADKLNETGRELQGNLALAMIITYLLMAALFESFLYPVVIMISVSLAMVGGFGGLWILNRFTYQALDMLTMLGFVILIGTVVNNAILIVHQALNYMREEEMLYQEAIVESVRTRIRPIFMSTLTTVLGMLPLVLPYPSFAGGGLRWVSGAGSELYRGLGSVVLGGLVVSTIFTLLLIPIGFSLAFELKSWILRKEKTKLPSATLEEAA